MHLMVGKSSGCSDALPQQIDAVIPRCRVEPDMGVRSSRTLPRQFGVAIRPHYEGTHRAEPR